jgi:hypothetical protein
MPFPGVGRTTGVARGRPAPRRGRGRCRWRPRQGRAPGQRLAVLRVGGAPIRLALWLGCRGRWSRPRRPALPARRLQGAPAPAVERRLHQRPPVARRDPPARLPPWPATSPRSPRSSPAGTANSSTSGSPPSRPTTSPTCTPSPTASSATTMPSATDSPCSGAQEQPKATSTGSRSSSGRCTATPVSTCSATESSSPPDHEGAVTITKWGSDPRSNSRRPNQPAPTRSAISRPPGHADPSPPSRTPDKPQNRQRQAKHAPKALTDENGNTKCRWIEARATRCTLCTRHSLSSPSGAITLSGDVAR